ncbi:hypothetical protein GUITHDRAFT_119466 [Guillardia theta CCMP2712]|uniref:Uncharacterized protein n=1 Tax=Guillardia theta (strain CCMP2712) TaxID=905079 RepID=L1IEQ5_GUITC|nr:hypothetical protein GUITHDRAFT_119466 [Guillardia theta CCMP2712]EKX34384.1 hypothetical protein GUITHDRAFT_119466 [Guillardia theta CCMP2712]|eukprot:XP_005821364.1 hypothetical protein GUITHDRAFT_119466 [Guillardia theta CCMP2712]
MTQGRSKSSIGFHGPGPGAYDVSKADPWRSDIVRIPTAKSQAPRFALSNSKSELDWVVHRSRQVPSPIQYGNSNESALKHTSLYRNSQVGGKMTLSRGMNSEEFIRKLKSSFPAPGAYGNPIPPHLNASSGGRTAKFPGPGQYALPNIATTKKNGPSVGKIGKASLMVGSMYNFVPDTPAPDHYYNPKYSSLVDSGGRFSISSPISELDRIVRDARSKPGPGNYKVGDTYGAFNNKKVWQPFKGHVEAVVSRKDKNPDISDIQSLRETNESEENEDQSLLLSLNEFLRSRWLELTNANQLQGKSNAMDKQSQRKTRPW